MKNIIQFFSLTVFLTIHTALIAQCPSGEVEVTIEVKADNYANEGYVELTPGGNSCGTGTIFNGGNSSVGCSGGGVRANPSGGYANNSTTTEGPFCLTDGGTFDLHYVDDYGDGGFSFKIFVNGFLIKEIIGSGSTNAYSFTASEPAAYDVQIAELQSPFPYAVAGSQDVSVLVKNNGTATVTSLDFSYSINGGNSQTTTLNSLNIPNNQSAIITHPVPWTATNGTYAFSVSVNNPNGNTDQVPANNTSSKNLAVGPGIPNIIGSFIGNSNINFKQIGSSTTDQLVGPTDLDFHPILTKKELWVVNKRTENQGGATVTFNNTNTSSQTSEFKVDGNAWHFMSLPTGIAFGENLNFATSAGVFDANHSSTTSAFTGPTLWSSDPAIYAQPSGGNGSHIDMLHESPYSQGIAHEKGNAYWVFDGNSNDIVRYDFVEDHGPGNDYHGDGIIKRYADVTVAKDPNNKVVSHLVLDKSTGWLYVVDYGNARVFRMDVNTGSQGGAPSYAATEVLASYETVTGYTWENVVTTGLTEPAGIDIIDNRMLVSDYSNGDIIIYDISNMPATELGRINTGAQGIMGIKIGPDGNIYYVDFDANKVMVAESGVSVNVTENKRLSFNMFPNPANEKVNFQLPEEGSHQITITNNLGQIVATKTVQQSNTSLETDYPAGVYFVEIRNLESGATNSRKLILNH